MNAPARHNLFVLYDYRDPDATPSTVVCPTASIREAKIHQLLDNNEARPGFAQIVPGTRFVRLDLQRLPRLAPRVKEVFESIKKPSSSQTWFIDTRTGHHVEEGWHPGEPIAKLSDLPAHLSPPRRRAPRPR